MPLNTELNSSNPFQNHRRIAILTDGFSTPFLAKTAISLLRYRPQDIVAVIDQQNVGKTTGEVFGVGDLPFVERWTSDLDCDAIYIGIAPPGGNLPEAWKSQIEGAIACGVDIVSGLHDFVSDDRQWMTLASNNGSRLIDVRKNQWKKTATGQAMSPSCLRIHTVGHDCSVGKMVTSLELDRGLTAAGYNSRFLATGQTGIMISGHGVPADCIVSDFVNGAVESLVLQNQDHDFVVVEGQGSISHPAYSAVTLGLLHGCAPQGLIFCYEAGRTKIKGFDNLMIPPLEQQLEAIQQMSAFRCPANFIGVAVNTRLMTPEQAAAEIQNAEQRFQLPACDVYRDGAEKLVAAAIELKQTLSQDTAKCNPAEQS